MRVVLDTNIFVSGIHWNGLSRRVLNAWLEGRVTVITSLAIAEEVMRILNGFKIPLSKHQLEKWERLILSFSEIAEPVEEIKVVKDPDDNKFLEAAVEGKAEYIVSQDKHLLVLKEFRTVKIFHPDEFIKLL
jgi:uncharacterized protein